MHLQTDASRDTQYPEDPICRPLQSEIIFGSKTNALKINFKAKSNCETVVHGSRNTRHTQSLWEFNHWPSMSYSPSSSSNSPSSSAVASWYCWYSLTKSFIFDSASVNSISSIPSPVYQCKNALRRNMAVKYSATRLNISWIAVELPAKATAIFKPFGGISQTDALMLFGIHSTKYEEFLFCTFNICSSTSLADIRPRKRAAAVR